VTALLHDPVVLGRGAPEYPAALTLLGGAAPPALAACGSVEPLRRPLLALFCSVGAPADAVLPALDCARALRDAGVEVVGGFHSPLERECLQLLLRGRRAVVVAPARALEGMRVPAAWAAPLAEGRLLVLSAAPPNRRRTTAAAAVARNRLVAALAERVLVLHATPGGRLHRLAAEALGWGKRVLCLDLPSNRHLRVLGAEPARLEALAPFPPPR
jgi:predicted Rossmann fold nucleotide-binding protein DprA/Smf involved in DNA uptake